MSTLQGASFAGVVANFDSVSLIFVALPCLPPHASATHAFLPVPQSTQDQRGDHASNVFLLLMMISSFVQLMVFLPFDNATITIFACRELSFSLQVNA